jgi:hypothetical protein
MQASQNIDLAASKATRQRRRVDIIVTTIVLFVLTGASLLTAAAVRDLRKYSSYETHSSHGTVVDAWAKHDPYSSSKFVVTETISYHKNENGMMVLRNCTLRGKSYDTKQIAELVAHEIVLGQNRHVRVPKHASEHTCLSKREHYDYLTLGILSLVVSAVIFCPFILLLAALAEISAFQCYRKWRGAASDGTVMTSRATEMTATAQHSPANAYAAVPTDDASAHGGLSVSAQVLQPDGAEQYRHILV